MLFDYLFLPVLFLLLLYFSWQDFKFGKISNKWLSVGLIWGGAVIVVLFLWSLMARPVSLYFYENFFDVGADQVRPVFTVSFLYLARLVWTFVSAAIFSFAFWKWRVWRAGDAKLFSLVALLLPLKYYAGSYFFAFPALPLLINVFSVAILWLLGERLFVFMRLGPQTKKKHFVDHLKKFTLNFKGQLNNLFLAFLFFLCAQIGAFLFLPNFRNEILIGSLILMILVWRVNQKNKALSYLFYVLFVFLLAVLILFWLKEYTLASLFALGGRFLGTMLVFVLVFSAISFFLKNENKKNNRRHFALLILGGTLLTIFLGGSVLSFLN